MSEGAVLSVPGTCWCGESAGSNTSQSALMTTLNTGLTAPVPFNLPHNIYPVIATSPRLYTFAQSPKLTEFLRIYSVFFCKKYKIIYTHI